VINNCGIIENYLHREVVGERIVLKRPLAGTTGPMLERLAGIICGRCDQKVECKPDFESDDIQRRYSIKTHFEV